MKHAFPFLVTICLMVITSVHAQDKLKSMPGYDQYKKIEPQIRSSVKS